MASFTACNNDAEDMVVKAIKNHPSNFVFIIVDRFITKKIQASNNLAWILVYI